MNFKKIALLFTLFTCILACNNDDDNPADNFDAAAQALIDDETLIEYLKSHYYIPAEEGEIFGVIDTIMNGETSLFDDNDNLKVQNVTENDINYKLYYFLEEAGVTANPARTDSVLVNYSGFRLDSVKFDERLSYTWLSLNAVIRGWSYGFTNFKGGINATQEGGQIDFSNTGNGILFIPSGLAYANIGTNGIGPNESLIFHIRLGLVEKADDDGDGLLSSLEDIDGDGDVTNDDSDDDNIPNFIDPDDDNDGVLTRDELELKKYIIVIGETVPTLASNEYEYDRMEDDENITIYTAVVLDSNNDGTPDYLDADTN